MTRRLREVWSREDEDALRSYVVSVGTGNFSWADAEERLRRHSRTEVRNACLNLRGEMFPKTLPEDLSQTDLEQLSRAAPDSSLPASDRRWIDLAARLCGRSALADHLRSFWLSYIKHCSNAYSPVLDHLFTLVHGQRQCALSGEFLSTTPKPHSLRVSLHRLESTPPKFPHLFLRPTSPSTSIPHASGRPPRKLSSPTLFGGIPKTSSHRSMTFPRRPRTFGRRSA